MNRKMGRGWCAIGCFTLFLWGVSLIVPNTAAIASGVQNKPASTSLARGAGPAAPDFALPDLNGSSVQLSEYRGERAVLLYFWATWCPHCVAIRPRLGELRDRIAVKDLEILAVNVGAGDSMEKVKRFQKKYPSTYPVLYDGDGKVADSYGVEGIPMFILIDKQGVMVYRDYELPENVDQYLR